MRRDEIVVLVPPELSAETEIAGARAGQDYTKAWGLHIATPDRQCHAGQWDLH